MPTEERFIKFTLNEAVEALRAISKRGKFTLPTSSAKSAVETASPEGELAVELTFNGSKEPVIISNAIVAAALISYYSRFNIPIPKQANKCLGVMGQSMMLRINSVGTNVSKSKQSNGNLTKKRCGKDTPSINESEQTDAEEFLL